MPEISMPDCGWCDSLAFAFEYWPIIDDGHISFASLLVRVAGIPATFIGLMYLPFMGMSVYAWEPPKMTITFRLQRFIGTAMILSTSGLLIVGGACAVIMGNPYLMGAGVMTMASFLAVVFLGPVIVFGRPK